MDGEKGKHQALLCLKETQDVYQHLQRAIFNMLYGVLKHLQLKTQERILVSPGPKPTKICHEMNL